MAQPGTNREVISVDPPNARVKTYGGEITIPIMSLSKMELCKACSIQFPKDEYPGRTWPWYSMPDMQDALLTNTCPDPKGRDDIQLRDPNAPATEKQQAFIRSLARKAGINANAVTTMGEASAEIKRLQDFINAPRPKQLQGNIPQPTPIAISQIETPNVDLSEVNERIAKVEAKVGAVATLINDMRPQIHEIHVPDREVIKLEGRQHAVFERYLEMLGAGLNVYLIGPPATGKSFMMEQAAKALSLPFFPISVSPDMDSTEFFGYRDGNGAFHDTGYSKAFRDGGFCGIDEMDHAHGGIATKLNNSIANGVVEFGGETIYRHKDNVVGASANTLGRGATKAFINANELSPATRNRFTFLYVDYDEVLETEIAMAVYNHEDTDAWLRIVRTYRRNAFEANFSKVYFTPRDSDKGARLLKVGWSIADVHDVVIKAQLTTDEIAKLGYGA